MTNTADSTDNIGDLRKQLEAAQAENKTLKSENSGFKQDEQLREAGLGHLSKRQRRSILRELAEEGTEYSADAAKEVAKELGYQTEAPTPPSPTADNNGNSGQPQGQPQGQPATDPEESLTAIEIMNKALGIGIGNRAESDLETEMKKTQNKEELRDLIRTKGARHGLVHDWDVP